MNKKKVFNIIIAVWFIFMCCVCGYNMYNYLHYDIKTSFTQEERELLKEEFKLDIDADKIRTGYYDGETVVVNIGPFYDKESMLQCFEFKLNRYYEETLENFDSGKSNYKTCFDEFVHEYTLSTTHELLHSEGNVYLYYYEGLYYFEIETYHTDLDGTIEIFKQ